MSGKGKEKKLLRNRKQSTKGSRKGREIRRKRIRQKKHTEMKRRKNQEKK